MSHKAVMAGKGIAVALALALGVTVTPAWAFEASVAVTPSPIAYYGSKDKRTTTSVQHRLTVKSGPQEERVVLIQSFGENPGGEPVLEGPGTLTPVIASLGVALDAGSPGRDGCAARNFPAGDARYELVLPAASSSTVVFERTLDRSRAPKSPNDFVASFQVAPTPGAGPSATTLPGMMIVSSAPPMLTGLLAPTLVLRAGLAGSGKSIGARERLQVRIRRSITLSGFLSPAKRGERVAILAFVPGSTTAKPVAVVRVDSKGRFLRRFRPTSLGTYAFYARRPGTATLERVRSACGGPQIKVARTAGNDKPEALSGDRYK